MDKNNPIRLLDLPGVKVSENELSLTAMAKHLFETIGSKLQAVGYLYTKDLIIFMEEHLEGANKSGNNRISQAQKLLNAYFDETTIMKGYYAVYNRYKSFNLSDSEIEGYIGKLEFGDANHYIIGGHITDFADFKYNDTKGKAHRIECKMHITTESYTKGLPEANMHNAELVIVYTISPKSNEVNWYVSRAIEGYSKLYTFTGLFSAFPGEYDWLHYFIEFLPKELTLIHIDVNSEMTNEQVPEVVEYNFYHSGGTY